MNDNSRDERGRFKKNNIGYWKGKKRPDMIGHTWNNGRSAWNKGLTKETDERVAKYAATITGEGNCKWKGDAAGYQSIHKYIRKIFGKPVKCEICGSIKNINWSSKDFSYSRDNRDSWWQLCSSCHRKYDFEKSEKVATIRFKLNEYKKRIKK